MFAIVGWCCVRLLFVFTFFCAVGVVVDVIMVTVVVALITSLRHGERSTILYTCVIICYSFRLPMLHVI